MLAKRLATAFVFIPIILYLVFRGDYFYASFIGLLAVIGMYEYLKMLEINTPAVLLISLAGIVALNVAIFIGEPALIMVIISIFFLLSLINLLVRFERTDLKESALIFWGFIYVGGLLGFLIFIRNSFDLEFTVFLFVVVWLSDTFAYFTGRKWGRKKLAPVLSPGKTVAGSVGAFLGTVLLISVFYLFIGDHFPLNYYMTVILTVIVIFFAQLGDLVESAIKRKLQAKDSGGIVPGHGGVLDRFDSIMLAAPFAFIFLYFVVG